MSKVYESSYRISLKISVSLVNDKFRSRLSDPHGFEAINICMKTRIFYREEI